MIDRDGRERTFSYDADNQRTAENWLDSMSVSIYTATYVYDADGQLTSASDDNSAYAYTYDSLGRETSVDNYGTPGDPTQQLTAVSGGHGESYSYDGNGNRTGVGYTISTGNQLTFAYPWTYAYDSQGNLIQMSANSGQHLRDFTWDYRNRLTEVKYVTVGLLGTTVTKDVKFTYDVNDRRIGKWVDPDGTGMGMSVTQTWTAYDGVNTYADFDNSGSLTNRYLYALVADALFARLGSGGTMTWYLTDVLGSVRMLTNASASVLDQIDYDSFGKILNETSPSNGDRFKFTGREYDSELGLYYYRARYYGPTIGRFISEDPLGFAAGDPNVYRYVFNAPATFTDPSGEFIWFIVIGAVAGAMLLWPDEAQAPAPGQPVNPHPGHPVIGGIVGGTAGAALRYIWCKIWMPRPAGGLPGGGLGASADTLGPGDFTVTVIPDQPTVIIP